MPTIQEIGVISSIIVLFIGIVVKYTRDRIKLQETNRSQSEITIQLKTISRDVTEDKVLTAENNRLVTAVHNRLDRVERAYGKLRINQVRTEEQVKVLSEDMRRLKDTQKIRPVD